MGKSKEIEGIEEHRKKVDEKNKLDPYKKSGQYQAVIKSEKEAARKNNEQLDKEILKNSEDNLKRRVQVYKKAVDEIKENIRLHEQDIKKLEEAKKNPENLLNKNFNDEDYQRDRKNKEDSIKKEKAELDVSYLAYTQALGELREFYAVKIAELNDLRERDQENSKDTESNINKYKLKLYTTEAQIWHNRAEELRELELKKSKKPEIAESFFSQDDPSNKVMTRYEDAFRRAEEAKMNIMKLIKDTGGKESYVSNEIRKIVKDASGDEESYLYDCIRELNDKSQLTNEDYHKKIFDSVDGLGERQQKAKFLAYFIEFSTKQYISCKITGAENEFKQVCELLLKKAGQQGNLKELVNNLESNLDQYTTSLEKNFGHINSNNIQLAIKKNESKEERVKRIAEIEFENSDYRKISKKLNKLVDDSLKKNKQEKKKLMKDNFKEIFSALYKLNILPNLGIVDALEKIKNYRERSKLTSSLQNLNIKDAHEIVKAIVPDARDKSHKKEK